MYDCIVIGGGIAGLQCSIMLGRYRRKVLIIDAGGGRSSLCRQYNNILGFPEGISGEELRKDGWLQAARYSVERKETKAVSLSQESGGFEVETREGVRYKSRTVLLATGVEDNLPDIAGLFPCLGRSIYVCPDCDGYEITNKKTVVIGSGDAGARMAETLMYWTKDLIVIDHLSKEISPVFDELSRMEAIPVIQGKVDQIEQKDGIMAGLKLDSGRVLRAEKAFLALGGSRPVTALAEKLGAIVKGSGPVMTDTRTTATNIEGLFAAGDVSIHSQLATVAMGEGAQAAIWIQKWLRKRE
ncbi:NAD(P)/FAD-dependent oxidoreductase [Halobacillus sp. ACCC02827]|uniref:NAD(P)/FAD-dependent oxidoreductase n=1 Tax=Halobacillus sp. ACCC02827 TaxID=3052090 RepID=UPI00257050FF|nr:NAD(P)/FAD-dependent oxidoreductase [Halobacillus sp. ACCC02827]WJE14241.1 NAD(P)/FAD-dependent oxidoreductase [Halobacillus sp. ACCC02827]